MIVNRKEPPSCMSDREENSLVSFFFDLDIPFPSTGFIQKSVLSMAMLRLSRMKRIEPTSRKETRFQRNMPRISAHLPATIPSSKTDDCLLPEGPREPYRNSRCLISNVQKEVIDAQRICPQNEEYKECGTACESKCAYPDPTECIDVCVEGCQCLRGYRRNTKGHCVLSKDC
ncbi:hypothetical protein ANTPLA_LOCUS218 [Anthophora plagiata]